MKNSGNTINRVFVIVCVFTILMLIISSVSVFAAEPLKTVSPTKDLSVENDNGKGSAFGKLAINYVQLKELSLDKAVIVSGDNYSIISGQPGSNDKKTVKILVWKGKISFGGNKRSASADASTKSNSLPAVTLKFPDSALLSDGRTADVIVKLDQIRVHASKSFASNINDNTNLQVCLMSSTKKLLELLCVSPKKNFDKYDAIATDSKAVNSGAAVGEKIRVTFKITEHADGNAVGSTISAEDYPSMLVVFADFDAYDKLKSTGASDKDKYNGTYSEGVELLSGWANPVVLAHNGKNIFNQSLVNKQTVNTDKLKIKGDGSQYAKLYAKTESYNDNDSYYSGFAAAVTPQGFSFNWYGSVPGGEENYSSMGTLIGSQPTVAVWAKRTEGGSLRGSQVGDWGKTTHMMNSAAEYDYSPDPGYKVKSLKVDGAEQTLTDVQKEQGGVYTFTRLNKYPQSERDYNKTSGAFNLLESGASSHYEIEVEFEKLPAADLLLNKNVEGNLGDITKVFEFRIDLTGLEPGNSYEITCEGAVPGSGIEENRFTADDTGKASVEAGLKDDTSLKISKLPSGTEFKVTEAKSDHHPSYKIHTEKGGKDIAAAASDKEEEMATGAVTITDSDTYIVDFTNERNIAVNTGVVGGGLSAGDFAAVSAMFLAAGTGAGIWYLFSRRRKNRGGSM